MSLIRDKIEDTQFVIIILIICYTVFFSYFTIRKHYAFWTTAGDLGFFDQALWSTLNGRPLYISLWEDIGTTTLAHHVQPILFLMLPLYVVFPIPETLLVLQSFILGLGALPVYWIAKEHLERRESVLTALVYLMYPALHGVNQFDFHPEALVVTFTLFSFHYFNKEKYSTGSLFCLLILFTNEVTGVFVSLLCLYFIIKNHTQNQKIWDKKNHALFFILVLSLLWFIVSIKIIVPHFSATDTYIHYSKWFQDITDLNRSLLHDVDKKFLYVALLFSPLLYTPLIRLDILSIAAPSFGIILLSRHSPSYTIGTHYPYFIIPILMISTIYGLKTYKTKIFSIRKNLLLILTVNTVFMLFISPSPLGFLTDGVADVTLSADMQEITDHHKALVEIIDLIPENASLSTQNNIFPHVSHSFHTHVWFREDDEWVLMDKSSPWFEFIPREVEYVEQEYFLVVEYGDIFLYNKKGEIDVPSIDIRGGILERKLHRLNLFAYVSSFLIFVMVLLKLGVHIKKGT